MKKKENESPTRNRKGKSEINKNEIKNFIICRKGNAYLPVPVKDFVLFYHGSKLTFARDESGNKYTIDKSLNDLMRNLDPKIFFRVNRKFILNINAIKEFKNIEFGKILLILKFKGFVNEEIKISQYTAPLFKEWISSL